MIEFVFMLTHDDVTVSGAIDAYEQVRDTALKYIGFKDIGAAPSDLAKICKRAHRDGREVMLEVVSLSAPGELRSIRMALDIGVDWVLGGTQVTEALAGLVGSGIRYCPFPGTIVGHPSILTGTVYEIAASAARLSSAVGVHGVDLLTYRHLTADPEALTRAVADVTAGPVIAAGSIRKTDQIRTVACGGAWGFTIGSAIFDGLLPGGPDLATQVKSVLAAAEQAFPEH